MNMRGGREENAEFAEGTRQGTRRGKENWGTQSTGERGEARHIAGKGDGTWGAGLNVRRIAAGAGDAEEGDV